MSDPNFRRPDIAEAALALWRLDVIRRKRSVFNRSRPSYDVWLVRDILACEQPRERLKLLGPEQLSLVELLVCLLGWGGIEPSAMALAQRILGRFGSLRGVSDADVEELASVPGVGLAKAARLKAAFELARRLELESVGPLGPTISGALEAARLARQQLSDKRKEHFILILLDIRHRVLRTAQISIGSLDMSVVHPRETFREAIVASAASVILAHNHPSGDPTPSPEDIALTHRLVKAGELLGIPVLDHLIVGKDRVLSFRKEGLL
jgi:DNA repair protein RadC